VEIEATLLVRRRGEIVEGERQGHIAVVDSAGRLVASAGDPRHVTYWRSAAKPFQALALVLSGAMERFGFGPRELALACASHDGTPEHTEIARTMLERIGLSQEDLECGVHEPLAEDEARSLRASGAAATPLHNNCSGKHAGMLAVCRARGYPPEGYHRPEHPLQREILEHVRGFTGVDSSEIAIGIDGCSVPCFAIPIERMAFAYARLASADRSEAPQRAAAGAAESARAAARIRDAMTGNPRLVAGAGRTSTEIMREFPGRVLSKGGAEGVLCGALVREGLGFALKMRDGFDADRDLVLARLLGEIDVGGVSEAFHVSGRHIRAITNHRGTTVGAIEAPFRLRRFAT
jgi:L-asparaginase II